MQSQHRFGRTPSVDVPRSSFDLSYPVKTTFDADYLVPIARPLDVIPGDTINWTTNFFMRLATPIHPILDNLYFETFAFFVPYRLIHANFEKMHGAQDNPGDSIDFTVPQRSMTQNAASQHSTLQHYFGAPMTNGTGNLLISDYPFRAYNLVFKDWFRDQNLQDSPVVDTGDSVTTIGNYPLRKRGKRHDYFTSCLPWPQKGDAVSLPLGTSAPIFTDATMGDDVKIDATNSAGGKARIDLTPVDFAEYINDTGTGNNLFADLSVATAATINDLRLAINPDANCGQRS